MSIQVKASFWFMICSFLQKGISVITTPIYTRIMTTVEYGQYSVFNSWMNIIHIFVTLQLTMGVYAQGLIKFSDDRHKFSSSLQGLTLTLVGIWTVIYLLFSSFWNNLFKLTTVQMLAMLVMIWASSVFSFWATEQRTQFKYRTLVIVTILISILQPVVSIYLILHSQDKVTAKILGFALVQLVGYFIFFIIQIKNGKTFYSKKYWTYALKFNIPLIPHYLSQVVLNSSDRIMIERMVGANEAGIYSLGYSLSLVMILFNSALMASLSPWIYQKIKDRKEKDIARIAYACLIGIALVNLALIALAPEAVKIFAPKEYYDAIYIIPPVAMSVYFMFAYDLFAKFEFYYEKTKWIAVATMASAVVNIITNYIFIKLFGYQAAGYTTLVCYILYALFHYVMMRKICKEYMDNTKIYDEKTLLLITTLFIVVGFILLFLYDYLILRCIFIAIIIIIMIVKRKEISYLFKTILKKHE